MIRIVDKKEIEAKDATAIRSDAACKQNRFELALSDILHTMDTPESYTQEDSRYDLWLHSHNGFRREFVALAFRECESKMLDYWSDGNLVLLVPHVRVESCEYFFSDMAKAGLAACAFLKKARAESELPKDKPKRRSNSKA